jgi:hypothetical protein
MKFFHRYEADGGLVLQDKECIIAAGRYILFYYPSTGEFLQIDEKISTYPGAVNITLNEYIGRMGFFRGLWLSIKTFLGVSHCRVKDYEEPEIVEEDQTFETFFEYSEPGDHDLRPPVLITGGYNEEV